MVNLKIEYLSKNDLKPYANNAKRHPAEQVEQIRKSIEQMGFNDPIAIWGENEIVEGHGRLLAVMDTDLEEVPVIRLDHLTDEQRKAYALIHNKLTMNSGFDFTALQEELDSLSFDMTEFGFEEDLEGPNYEELFQDAEPKPKEPKKVQCPHCGEWFEV